MKIGFIGQGFIGKNMADDMERRGYDIVRYALEPDYINNKEALSECDIIFVAVPTPTTPKGFDTSILESALQSVPSGGIVVIKSTMLPGTTNRLQDQFSDIIILHSPEFLREKTAREDTEKPLRTIVGIPHDLPKYRQAADKVIAVLPTSPFTTVCQAKEAELIKYGGNCFLAMKVVFMNLMYDAAMSINADYRTVAGAMAADPRIGTSHMNVIDQSGHSGSVPGRGAGGHCFPKDLAAFADWYQANVTDSSGADVWQVIEAKNTELLRASQKDLDLLRGIYGA